MNFKFIHQLNNEELKKLYKLVHNKDNMKYLGNGKPWNKKKFINIYNYDKIDYQNNYVNSKYLYNVLIDNDDIIGLAYIHPGIKNYQNKNTIGIIINKKYRNKGYGKILIAEMIKLNKKYFNNKKLYAIVNINNINSNNLVKKYYLQKRINYKNNNYNIYLLS